MGCLSTTECTYLPTYLPVGASVWMWGPNTVPLACMPRGGCVPRGWWGAVPGGGGLPPS